MWLNFYLMGSPKRKRARIKRDIKDIEVIADPIAYKPNCASENAQLIHQYDELKVELWCDKHYHNRRTFGDVNGRREGIEVEGVQELIIDGFKYLLDFFLRGVPFKFINYFDINNKNKLPYRVVIKRRVDVSVLNVVAEIHYLDTSKFEITVITAMVTDNFKVSDGQYALTISNNSVVLRRNIQKSMNEVYRINT